METCKRTYQVIYFILLNKINSRSSELLTSTPVFFLQSYKPLKNGIIDSQFCTGEAEGGKVKMDAYCFDFH